MSFLESGQESLLPNRNPDLLAAMGSNQSLPESVDGERGGEGFHKHSTITNSLTPSDDDSNGEQVRLLYSNLSA